MGLLDDQKRHSVSTVEEERAVLVGLVTPQQNESKAKEYLDELDDKVIYAGYINWMKDLFKFADLNVLTDDGISIQEALTAGKPIITLTRIKWGRYENMAGVYVGAMIESEVKDVCKSIDEGIHCWIDFIIEPLPMMPYPELEMREFGNFSYPP